MGNRLVFPCLGMRINMKMRRLNLEYRISNHEVNCFDLPSEFIIRHSIFSFFDSLPADMGA